MAALIISFSNTLKDLYTFVQDVSPDDKASIETLRNYTKALENTGYQIFFDWTWSVLKEYQVEILECNQSFFLSMEFDSDQDKNYFSRFSSVYKGLSEDNRVKLWWYFQQLIKIGQRVERVL
jgi:hypothetical protein